MQKLTRSILAALVCASCNTAALAKDVTVAISGGFKAALEKLAPEYEAQSGDKIILVSGPSMGKTPQAIPARLARGEQADVLIMVGDALTTGKERWTQPGSRVELADSPIGMVVKQGAPKPVIKRMPTCAMSCCRLTLSPIPTAPAAAASAANCSKAGHRGTGERKSTRG